MIKAAELSIQGLHAATARAAVAAQNIAHAQGTGRIDPATGAYDGYRALRAVQDTGPAGPRVTVAPRDPGFVRRHDPDHPLAGADGIIGAPAVDPVADIVALKLAHHAYRANAAALRSQLETGGRLLEIVS